MKILLLLLVPLSHYAQTFQFPDSAYLYQAIDRYYEVQSQIQINELKQTRKFHWLAYLPSPGYSPFMGRFTLSVNLLSPLQEVRTKYQLQQKQQAIYALNRQQAQVEKQEVRAALSALQLDIEHYKAKSTLDSIRQQAYQLTTALYDRNEVTPSEFLTASTTYESWRIQRQAEYHAILKKIATIGAKKENAR